MQFLARLLAAVLFFTLTVDVSAAEAATKPSAPRSVKATPSNQAVKVRWAAPSSNGGAAIDKYAVQRFNFTTRKWNTVKTTSSRARSWTNTGLTNGRKYYFRVVAHNRLGWGRVSAQASATPRTVPAAPRYLEADLYNSALGTFWLPPATDGGAPVDSYRVEISIDGATWTGARNVPTPGIKTDAPVMFTGLTAGTRYWLRVRAHNAAGYSVGTSSGPYRAIAAPGPVTNLLADLGDGQVELSWAAPEANAHAPAIAQYKVEQSENGTTWTDVAITTSTSLLVTGLTNGTAYQFRVSARSTIERVGYGTTASVSPGAPTGAPTVPLDLTLEGSDGDNKLDWAAPANNGGILLTRYEVESWTNPMSRSSQEIEPDTTETLVAELALTHTFRVRACNGPEETDCSPWTDDLGPIPDEVTDPTIQATGSTVSLAWAPPANDDVTVDDYTVSRSTDAGITWSELATTTDAFYTDHTAAFATAYSYRIVANGSDGSGGWAPLEITTDAHQLSVSPTSITVTENSSNSFQVTLDPVATADTIITVDTSNAMAAVPAVPTVTVPLGQASANVTVNGVNDPNVNAESVTITITYGTQTRTVSVTVIDDDLQSIVLSNDTATIDDGENTVIDASLEFQPSSNVTVFVSSGDTGTATVSTGSLTFTPSNWNTPQSVTITGEAPGSTSVSFSSTGVSTRNVSVTVEEPTP